MKAVLAVLLLSVVLIHAASIQADFELRAPYLRSGGVVTGNIVYDWGTGNLRFNYPKQNNYFEIHEYNAQRGYDATSSVRYRNQWNYQVGTPCGCETGSLDNVMPILTADGSSYLTSGFDKSSATINGIACDIYTLKAGQEDFVGGVSLYANFYAYKSGGFEIVQMKWNDGRVFNFKNVRAWNTDASQFKTPDDCKCGRPIDIVIVLDRSGSIDATEWRDQKGFMVNFTKQFDYGPLGANLAVTNFNKQFWTTLTLAQGNTAANVINTVGGMGCSGHESCNSAADNWQANPTISCCCCGTSISGGMHTGADLLAQSTRKAITTKIMLTVTDGYANTMLNLQPCSSYSPGGCKGDLQNEVNYAQNTVPGIIMYAVGVGDDRTFSRDELLICAQGVDARLLTVGNFAELAAATLELVARTCNENTKPCGGCCGFCSCGSCLPVEACDAPADLCSLAVLPSGAQTCCSATPKTCDPDTQCTTYKCNSATGNCDATTLQVPPSTACTSYSCDNAVGIVKTSLDCPTPVPDCTTDSANVACNDGNECTLEACDISAGADKAKCTFNTRKCETEAGFAPDQCSAVGCDPKTGCYRTPVPADFCDDNNNCTIDSCDPVKGCVHVDVVCDDKDFCTTDTCHKTLGCIFSPLVCNISRVALSANDQSLPDSCLLAFCANGTCATRKLECAAGISTSTIVGATLGTAAVIGLVIAGIVVLAAIAGGGAYAYSQAAGGGGLAVTGNNPIYAGSGNAGTNPLYKA